MKKVIPICAMVLIGVSAVLSIYSGIQYLATGDFSMGILRFISPLMGAAAVLMFVHEIKAPKEEKVGKMTLLMFGISAFVSLVFTFLWIFT